MSSTPGLLPGLHPQPARRVRSPGSSLQAGSLLQLWPPAALPRRPLTLPLALSLAQASRPSPGTPLIKGDHSPQSMAGMGLSHLTTPRARSCSGSWAAQAAVQVAAEQGDAPRQPPSSSPPRHGASAPDPDLDPSKRSSNSVTWRRGFPARREVHPSGYGHMTRSPGATAPPGRRRGARG